MADWHYGLVLSSSEFSKKTGFALVCPITSNVAPWPFDVHVPAGLLPPKHGRSVNSVVLTDQVKSVDFRDRGCSFVHKAPDAVVDDVLAKVRAILDSDDVVREVTD
jgi:mRNA interferase MazF